MQSIVKKCGLPSSGKRREPLRVYQIPQRRRIPATQESKHRLSLEELRTQAVKEICYEVALGDFKHTRQEIEALAIVRMKELYRTYGQKDPQERESWKSVAKDVCETVGIGEEEEDREERTTAAAGGGASERGKTDMGELKAHIDKLTDILQEVKLQNNMKDEEIRSLRDRMVKMEKIFPVEEGEDDDIGSYGVRGDEPPAQVDRCDEDSGYQRGRHRWQYPEKYHNPKRRKGAGNQPNNALYPAPPSGHSQSNPSRFSNPSFIPQTSRHPNGPFMPGTGRFLPPHERKLQFPFKNNPQHRGFIWGPSSGGESRKDPSTQSSSDLVHTFHSYTSPNKGQWPNSHHQQRRNHGNRGYGNWGNRQRSRNRGRNPFDGYLTNEQVGNVEHKDAGSFQHKQGRVRYTWYSPSFSSDQSVGDGFQHNYNQSRQGVYKYPNSHYQHNPPETTQRGSEANPNPTSIPDCSSTPMET